MAAEVPLKSKRVAISLAVVSTAFFTSTKLGSQTVSKDGMGFNNQVRECDNSPMNVTQNVALQPYNSFGIVAKAYSLVRICSEADALTAQKNLKNHPEGHCVLGVEATLS
jgi:hypothetical protein